MPQFNDTELTAAVIQSFEETPDPRVKFLLQELVKSLHDYVRKTDLTFEEWEYAIDFLTRTGQKCTPIRQEFILLSDVLGVSMLVDAVNHREREGATETTVLGPFYVGEHKPTPHGADISASLPGERMFVQSRVTDLEGQAAGGRSGRRLARRRRRLLQFAEAVLRDAGPVIAGALHHRRRWPVLLSHHPAVQLSDPDRRSGRRDDHPDAASSRCGRRMCISWSMRPATSR